MEVPKAQDVTIEAVELAEVENQNPKPNASKKYIPLLGIENGKKVYYQFTKNELKRPRQRAINNPEDCPKESFWSKYGI